MSGILQYRIALSGSTTQSFSNNFVTASFFKGDGTQITGVISSSYSSTSSIATGLSFIPPTASFATVAAALEAIAQKITGSLTVSGTIDNTGYSLTSSFFKGDGTGIVNVISSSYATTASYATIAQNVLGSITSASYALTSSFASSIGLINAGLIDTASLGTPYVLPTIAAILSASYAVTASYVSNPPTPISSSYSITSSYASIAQNVLGSITSASYALTASYAQNGSGGPTISSSYAITSSYATIAQTLLGSVVSASYAATSSYTDNLMAGDTLSANHTLTGSIFVTGSAIDTNFWTWDNIGIKLLSSGQTLASQTLRFNVGYLSGLDVSSSAGNNQILMQHSTSPFNQTSNRQIYMRLGGIITFQANYTSSGYTQVSNVGLTDTPTELQSSGSTTRKLFYIDFIPSNSFSKSQLYFDNVSASYYAWIPYTKDNGNNTIASNVDLGLMNAPMFQFRSIYAYQTMSAGQALIGPSASFTSGNPEALSVNAGPGTSFNIATLNSSVNNYSQLNVLNRSNGNTSSADLVATNDSGSEVSYYVNLGINGGQYALANNVGGAGDGYIYSLANKFYIGNASTGSLANVYFFAGGVDSAANTRMFISSSGQVGIGTLVPTTALQVVGTVSASLFIGDGTNISNVSAATSSYVSSSAPGATPQGFFSYAHASGTFGRRDYWIPNCTNATALTATTAGAGTINTISAYPFISPVNVTSIEQVVINVTAGGGANETASVAIYQNAWTSGSTQRQGALHPGILIYSGTIPIGANLVLSASANFTMEPGTMYWYAIHHSGSATTAFRGIAIAGQEAPSFLGSSNMGTALTSGLQSASVWGAGASYSPKWPSPMGNMTTLQTNATVAAIGLVFAG